MRRGGSGDDVVRVEMVEADEPSAAAPSGSDGIGVDPGRRRRLRWTGIGVLAALVVVVAAAGVVGERRDAARRAALAQIEGVLEPFGGPLVEAWRLPAGWPLIASDSLLVLQGTGSNPPLTAVDPSSGAVLWHREGALAEWCTPLGGDLAAEPSTPTDRIVCTQTTDVYLPDDVAVGSLVVLDAVRGTELRSLPLDASVLFVQTADDDVILTSVDARSRLEVRRWDPAADREVWRYLSEPGLLETLVDDGPWGREISDGVYRFGGEDEALSIDVATGERVPSVPRSERMRPITWPLPDGGTVELTLPGPQDPYGTRVLDADGSVRYEMEATPWVPWITDGSVPSILAVQDPLSHDVIGLDAATGDRLWIVDDVAGVESILQIDGIAVGLGSGRAVGLDMAEGAVLWEADVAYPDWWSPLTDGEVVVLLTASDAATYLAALDLKTGEQVWRVPVPDTTRYAETLGRAIVLVHTDTDLIAFR